MRSPVLLAAAFAAATVTSHAVAADGPPPAGARGLEAPERPSDAEDAALFVPRVLLFVPRLVLTAAFLPIQHGLRALSRSLHSGGDALDDDVRTVAVLPHLSYASGFGAT